MPTAISVHSLQKTFERQIEIDGLSFEVDSNEFVAIVGPSGCGKSTTLRIVAGLERPSSGTVRASGEMVDGPIGNAAMVFQAPVLLPWRRTLSNVLFAAEMRGKRPGAFRQRAQDLIALTGLDGFEHSYPVELARPRDVGTLKDPAFVDLCATVREAL